ncbi:MAG TPA: DUF3105 domain-containing protein [Polyangiaceae bacterium]|nr:DUF3105 domain-containing protein [Polyangiaceae bacterium]
MFAERTKTAPMGWILGGLAMPLLLSHCGDSADSPVHAGAGAGNTAQSGTAGQSGAAAALGGAMTFGGAFTSDSGSAGTAGLGGDSAAAGSATAGSATHGGSAGETAGAAGSGECTVQLASYTSPTAAHVAVCSTISYPMNPPVYGDHYPVWAAYKSYPFPVPLGFLVHNLEHGAVVLLYNCPEGCAEEVAAAQAFIDALPTDPRCADDVKHQVVMSPAPSLPTRWGAVAWGHSLASDCFAADAFRAFYTANLAHGGEDICANGADLLVDSCQ